jgi:predicted Zn-dependent protease
MRRLLTLAVLPAVTAACSVSTQQEVQMGTNYAQQINAQLPIIKDPEVNRYINVLGDSIAKLSDDRGLEWHFYVVDSREVNAFAVPGGFIYVNRGLIERADNMSQLACVLTRVCNNQATGALINVAGGAVFARFSRQDEAEADAKGVEYVTRANISPNGIPEMFEKLLAERSRRPEGVEAWFATHPLEENRIVATRAQISRINPVILEGLTVDSPRFQDFKQRVMALPPSPAPRTGG